MNRVFQWIAVLTCCVVSTAAPAQTPPQPAKVFPHPDRIRYDGHCLTIEGRDTFVYSGAFHYFRCPKELWRDRFRKIKEAHFNAVETYVPWNWHERDMPSAAGDHSKIDLTDLKDWMRMAHEEFGLYTIIRPGPYICAEWNGGGFPQWLWSKQPADWIGKVWIRSDEPTFIAWSKHWMDAVVPVVAAEQITRKAAGEKGVILFQIENEYDYHAGVPNEQRVRHLKFLYRNAVANGIDVPIFTCWTKPARGSRDAELSQVFDSSNYYHRWDMADTRKKTLELKREEPNAPAMISELQGGWFANAGGQLSEDQDGIGADQITAITLTAIANGVTISNYYMLFGGSNFGTWAGGDLLQTYDYFAPIRETGAGGAKYEAVKAIGAFLATHGPAVARSELIESSMTPADAKADVTVRRTVDGQLFVFCRSTIKEPQTLDLQIKLKDGQIIVVKKELPTRIVAVLALPVGKTDSQGGTWWCEPGPEPTPPRVPAPVRVSKAWTRDDPGPTHWRTAAPGASVMQAGIHEIADVVYRSRPTLTAEQVAKFTTLRVSGGRFSRLVLRANGHIVLPRAAGANTDFALAGILREGDNALELLFQNHGIRGFGEEMSQQPGVTRMALTEQTSGGRSLENWRVAIVKAASPQIEVATDFDDAAWETVVLDEKTFAEVAASKQPGNPPPTYPAAKILFGKNATAVYRTEIELTEQEVATNNVKVEFQSIDDRGDIYVNGEHVGVAPSWRVPFVGAVSKFVKPGRNVIAVVVRNTDFDGGITKPAQLFTTEDGLPLDYELGTVMTGVAEGWWKADTADDWQSIELNTDRPLARQGRTTTAEKPRTLKKWFRTEFTLPTPEPGVWAPWGAVIDARGDGLLYLNGHALGRFYDAGPQRTFYLPECWLNFGDGATNVLTMALRPVTGEPALTGVELAPYAGHAEKR